MKPVSATKSLSRTKQVYHIGAMLAYYTKDDALKQRHLNVMIETVDGNITKDHLNRMHMLALSRLKAENDVNMEQVQDVVITSLSALGHMTEDMFHGASAQTTAKAG